MMRDLTEINQSIARQEFYIGMARRGHKRYEPVEQELRKELEDLIKIQSILYKSKEDINKNDNL
jgi:hypothetical protein